MGAVLICNIILTKALRYSKSRSWNINSLNHIKIQSMKEKNIIYWFVLQEL